MVGITHHFFFVLLLDHLPGDILSNFHHFDHLPIIIKNRVVTGLQPYPLSAPVHPFKTPGDKLAACETPPMLAVIVRMGKLRWAEHRMRLSPRLLDSVAHQFQHIVVGGKDLAVRVKGDHCHRTV
ncbi:hypothetical protein D3C72_1389010 [compost metagenome]